jgi:hypothetical protein
MSGTISVLVMAFAFGWAFGYGYAQVNRYEIHEASGALWMVDRNRGTMMMVRIAP